jgi:ankyrin repeat protein
LHAKNKYGQTAFHLAVEAGEMEIVKWILHFGPPDLINVENIYHKTPFLAAAEFGKYEIMNWMVEHTDAVIDQVTHRGITPLMYACAGDFVVKFAPVPLPTGPVLLLNVSYLSTRWQVRS